MESSFNVQDVNLRKLYCKRIGMSNRIKSRKNTKGARYEVQGAS